MTIICHTIHFIETCLPNDFGPIFFCWGCIHGKPLYRGILCRSKGYKVYKVASPGKNDFFQGFYLDWPLYRDEDLPWKGSSGWWGSWVRRARARQKGLKIEAVLARRVEDPFLPKDSFHFIDSRHVAIPVYTRLFSIKSAAKHLASCTWGICFWPGWNSQMVGCKNAFSKISVGFVLQVPDAAEDAEAMPWTKPEIPQVIRWGRFGFFRSFQVSRWSFIWSGFQNFRLRGFRSRWTLSDFANWVLSLCQSWTS